MKGEGKKDEVQSTVGREGPFHSAILHQHHQTGQIKHPSIKLSGLPSLGPRPNTNPSTDRFHNTGSDVHAR